MSLFKLGQITSPVGIKGEVRVYPYLDDMTLFLAIKKVLIEGEKDYRNIEKNRSDKNMAVLKIEGIDDRNQSEGLRNKFIFVEKDDIDMPEDMYYIEDLVGMKVYDEDGKFIGDLESVDKNSPQDKYVIKTETKSFMLPAVKEFILNVDVENKKMTVHLIDGIVDL